MRIAKGNPLSFSPTSPGYLAWFRGAEGETWSEPVVGFAVVVMWTGWDEEKGGVTQFEDEADLAETRIVPVVLESGHLVPAHAYAEGRDRVTYTGLMMPPA